MSVPLVDQIIYLLDDADRLPPPECQAKVTEALVEMSSGGSIRLVLTKAKELGRSLAMTADAMNLLAGTPSRSDDDAAEMLKTVEWLRLRADLLASALQDKRLKRRSRRSHFR